MNTLKIILLASLSMSQCQAMQSEGLRKLTVMTVAWGIVTLISFPIIKYLNPEWHDQTEKTVTTSVAAGMLGAAMCLDRCFPETIAERLTHGAQMDINRIELLKKSN